MRVLKPDTSIEMLFEDTNGLLDELRERQDYKVKYNPRSRASQASSQWIVIGAKIPFEEIKNILVKTLIRYEKIQYYSVSNDFFLKEFYLHYEITIGASTKYAKERALQPIKINSMLEALENLQSTEELLDFIRSHYSGNFKTFDIEPIMVTSYFSAATGAVDPPASQLKIRGYESLRNAEPPARYGLTIHLFLSSTDDFVEQFPEIVPMFNEWLRNRGDAAQNFALAVNAEADIQKEIDECIKDIYSENTEFSNTLKSLKFTVVISNRANDLKIYYELGE